MFENDVVGCDHFEILGHMTMTVTHTLETLFYFKQKTIICSLISMSNDCTRNETNTHTGHTYIAKSAENLVHLEQQRERESSNKKKSQL